MSKQLNRSGTHFLLQQLNKKILNICLFGAEFDEKSISEKLKLLPERGPRIACVYKIVARKGA